MKEHHRAHREEWEREELRHEESVEGLRAAAAARIADRSSVRSGPGQAAQHRQRPPVVARSEAPDAGWRQEHLREECRAMLAKLQGRR